MPAKRLPWVRLWVESLEHEKVALLSDAEYRTWTMLLLRGSQQPTRWRFASVRHAALVVGRPVGHVKTLVTRRLIDVQDDGAVWVHDWKQWQERYPSDFLPRSDEEQAGDCAVNVPPISSGTLREDSANAPRSLHLDRDREEERESSAPAERVPDADAPASPALRAVPKPAKRDRSKAPTEPPHPALLIAREVLQLHRPDQTQRAAILAAVADEPDALARWQRCCTAWRLAGFNVRNIAGPLEWFADGGPPELDKSRGRNGNGSRAAAPIRSVADLAAQRLKLIEEMGYDGDGHDGHFTNGTGSRGGVAAELSGVPPRHGPAHQQLPAPRGG